MKINLFGQEIESKYLIIAAGVLLILGLGMINHSNQTKHMKNYKNSKPDNESKYKSKFTK